MYTIYVDGSPAGSETNSVVIPNPNAPLMIGQAEGLFFTDGRMDEVHIFERALTALEIQTIFNAGSAGLCTDMIYIGGFDAARGANFSLPEGDALAEARVALTTTYPAATFTSFATLTQPALANVDILILSSVYDGSVPITPLTAAEQTALYDFVTGGGCAVLLPDNWDFAPANESLIDPFGMDIGGFVWGWITATVTPPATHAITDGPHGTAAAFSQGWPGGLTNLGPDAAPLATNSLGDALVVIKRNALKPGSGPVIVYSDVTTFADTADGGDFANNQALFLNSIAYCLETNFTLYLPLAVR